MKISVTLLARISFENELVWNMQGRRTGLIVRALEKVPYLINPDTALEVHYS